MARDTESSRDGNHYDFDPCQFWVNDQGQDIAEYAVMLAGILVIVVGTYFALDPRLAACPGGKVGFMADTTNPESFEEIVEWAYGTLPQKIRDLPDFPGIQVVDEPPADVLGDISKRKKWRRGTELLGLYSGTFRTKRSFAQVPYAPELIFVFRGPILRCSRGDLRAEVKRVVWHEVAHWLGYETEEQVKALGL